MNSANGSSPAGAVAHPERFDPACSADTLMDAEHRGRYWWAAQLLADKSVLDAGCGTGYGLEILAAAGAADLTGVDLDAGAVAESRSRGEGCGATVVQGDLQALVMPDDSFDAAVCFETIEHLESPDRGLAELRRVVRPGGMIVVSSPNPDVYPPGNEHHRHELRPQELCDLVGRHFGCVRMYLQHPWVASAIEPAEGNGNGNGGNGAGAHPVPVRRSAAAQPQETTFAIVVGCDEGAPDPAPLVSMADPFEVKWWQQRVEEAETRGGEAEAETARALAAERRAAEAEAEAAALSERLAQVNKSLIDANQELAQMPLLKHRLAEMYELKASYEARLNEVVGSRSWQATGFLRRFSRALKLQR